MVNRTRLSIPVAFIAPCQEAAELAIETSQGLRMPIVTEVSSLSEGVGKARLLLEKGVEVIISQGQMARLLKRELEVPVVEVKITATDVLKALRKVPKRKQRIGIVGFEDGMSISKHLGDLLGLNLTVFTIRKEGEVLTVFKEAKEKKIEMMMGDGSAMPLSSKTGQLSLSLEPGRESLMEAIEQGYEILEIIRNEARKTEGYRAAIDQFKGVWAAVDDQIIILDSDDRIQLCNPAAQRMFKKEEHEIIGSPLFLYPTDPLKKIRKKLTPQRNCFAEIQGKYVLLDYVPIETDGERTGTLILGRSISKLQQVEREIRTELYLRGHVARFSFSDIVTMDGNFQKIVNKARNFSTHGSTILIIGETGTGKEMFAQSIHNENFGSKRPFVAINCATLPETLLESELFGYAPGAFTGAKKEGKKGLFELAHGGTLLLDEISELPLNLQSRLLRIIEQREVQPIGDDRVIPVDVRIIVTSNKDLMREVNERRFRGDLFHRLNVLQLNIPPLRERGHDPYVLYRHFVKLINPKPQIKHLFSKEAEDLLCGYHWPGNVRELRNFVERLAALTDHFNYGIENATDWIREELRTVDQAKNPDAEWNAVDLNLKEMERAWIKKSSESFALKKSELARLLGISRTTLWKRLKVQ